MLRLWAKTAGSILAAMDPWSRRDFLRAGLGLTGLGLLAGCGVASAPGQGAARTPRIGFLAPGDREDFLRGLREHGYEPGQTIHIEYRFSQTIDGGWSELATELVDLDPDVLVTIGASAGLAAKQATGTIPIVAAAVPDPVGSRLVPSLAGPGGNVTGVSTLGDNTDMKRMERLKEVVPAASRVAVLANPGGPGTGPRLANFEAAARVLGQQVRLVPARTPDDLAGAFAAAADWGADALLVPSGGLALTYPAQVVELAARHRLPDFYEHRESTELGGLASYGPDYAEIYRGAAAYVDRILNGAKPADLPVEEPTIFDFAINLKTAQGLGLTIPQSVLAQATEVIQ
jgi:putative tryptophan/tyrosine transport system substrate-binding protein